MAAIYKINQCLPFALCQTPKKLMKEGIASAVFAAAIKYVPLNLDPTTRSYVALAAATFGIVLCATGYILDKAPKTDFDRLFQDTPYSFETLPYYKHMGSYEENKSFTSRTPVNDFHASVVRHQFEDGTEAILIMVGYQWIDKTKKCLDQALDMLLKSNSTECILLYQKDGKIQNVIQYGDDGDNPKFFTGKEDVLTSEPFKLLLKNGKATDHNGNYWEITMSQERC